MSEQKQIVYIDTSILISPIFDDEKYKEKNAKEDKKKNAKNILDKLAYNSNNYKINIPHVVVGEAINEILQKSNDKFSNIQKFINILHDLNANLEPLDREGNIAKIASVLRACESNIGIDFCDLIIIAYAVHHAKHSNNKIMLFMQDSKVRKSFKIKAVIEEEVSDKVEILEEFLSKNR
jgi:predicted nucleic acid-binding protein